jgi:hypothetical protein
MERFCQKSHVNIHSFVMSFLIHIPRNFTLVVKDFEKDGKYCGTTFQNEQLLTYSSLYFTVINTVLLTLFCLCMLVCTVYIVYKFLTHNFRFRPSITVKKRSERKSALLVVIVLLICLVIEIPRVFMYVVSGKISLKMSVLYAKIVVIACLLFSTTHKEKMILFDLSNSINDFEVNTTYMNTLGISITKHISNTITTNKCPILLFIYL